MWEPQPLVTLRASAACTGITLLLSYPTHCLADWPLYTLTAGFRHSFQPTVSRQFCFGVKPRLGPKYLIFVTVRQFRSCLCGAPCMIRGWVCRLQLLLALSSAVILGSEFRRTHGSDSRITNMGEVSIPQDQGDPGIYTDAGFPFLHLLLRTGLRWLLSDPQPHGLSTDSLSKSKSHWH
jgi:hypothetical protein